MAVDTPWLGEYTWEEHGFDGDGTRSKPLPNEVVDMFRPHQCLLCNITASNLQCVYAHYESQSHFKKVAHFMREKYNVLGTLKAKKDQFQPVECDICQVTLTRRILYLQHLDSKQHLKNMKKKGDSDQPSTPQASETMNMYTTIPQPPPLPKMGEYVCSLCTVTTPTKAQMELHNSGARHMKNVSKLADGDLRDFFAENGNYEPIIVDSLTPDPPKEKPPENNLVNPFMYPYAGNSMYGQPTAPYTAGNPQMMPHYQQYPYGSQYNQYPYPYQYPANYDYSSWQGQGYQQYPPLPDTTMPPPTYDNPTNDDATLTSPSVTAPVDKPEVKPSESDSPPESPLPEGSVKLLKDEATQEEVDGGKTSIVEDDNGEADDHVEPVEKATDEEEHIDNTPNSHHSENEDPITNDAQVIDNIDQLDHTPAENFKEFTISSKPTLNRLTTFMSSVAEDEASKEVKKRPVLDSESEEHEDVETMKPSIDDVKALNDSLEKEVQESLVNYEISEPVEEENDTTFASRDNDVSNDENKAEADKMVPEEQNVKNDPKIEEIEPDVAEEIEKTITTDAIKKDHKEDKAQLIKIDDKKDKKSRSRSKSRAIRKRRSRSSSSASSSSSRDSLKRRRRRSRSRSWSRSPDRRRRFRPNYRRPDNYNRGYNPNFRQQRYRNYYPNRNQWSRGSNYRNYGRREDRSYWNNREENDRRRYRNRREYTDRRPRRRSVSRSASSSSASKSRSRSPRRDDRKMKNKPEGRPIEEKFDDKVVQVVENDQPIMKRASRIDINITSVKVDEEHSFMSENHSPASFNSMSPKNDKEKETIDDEAEINDKEAEIINKEKEIIAKVKPFQPICDPVLLDRLSPVCNPTTQTWDTESQKVKSETFIKGIEKESHREEEESEDVSQLLTKMIILKKKMAEEEAYKEQRQKDKSKKKKRRRSASSSSSSSSSSESSSSSSSSSCSVPTDLLSRFIATMKHSGAPSGKVKEDDGDVKKGDKKKKKKKKKRKKKKKEKKTKKSSRNDHDSSNLSSFVNSRGLYECKLCDVTATTDMSFVEHLLSEKHKNIFQLIKSQQIQ